MAHQKVAANGEPMTSKYVPDWVVASLELPSLPKGFVGFSFNEGLVEAILKPDTAVRKVRLGKFLERGGQLSKEEINIICRKAVCLEKLSKSVLKFARTEEEILRVYKLGPNSCMSGCASVKVYATDDVAVAYLELGDEIVARSVVCVNEDIGLQYVAAYGISDVLVTALEKAGYVRGCLDGCNLKHIRNGYGEIVMPYLDGTQTIQEPDSDDEFVVVSKKGDVMCNSTTGRVRRPTCCACEEVMSCEDELYYSERNDEELCERCFYEQHELVDDVWYHKAEDAITETQDDGWMLSEGTVYVDYRDEHHPTEKCIYNSYIGEYYLESDFFG